MGQLRSDTLLLCVLLHKSEARAIVFVTYSSIGDCNAISVAAIGRLWRHTHMLCGIAYRNKHVFNERLSGFSDNKQVLLRPTAE